MLLRRFSSAHSVNKEKNDKASDKKRGRHSFGGIIHRNSLGNLKPKLLRKFSGFFLELELQDKNLQILELVSNYLNDLCYPPALTKKILRKFKRKLQLLNSSSLYLTTTDRLKNANGKVTDKNTTENNHNTVAEEQIEQITDNKMRSVSQNENQAFKAFFESKMKDFKLNLNTDDYGMLEEEILGCLPLKYKVECLSFLYGKALKNSQLFLTLTQSLNETSKEKDEFLRYLSRNFQRQLVGPGGHFDLSREGIYVVRRGGCKVMINGDCVMELTEGAVFEAGVIVKGYLSAYSEDTTDIFGLNICSVCSLYPKPSSSYFYGCEIGFLSKRVFDAILLGPTSLLPLIPDKFALDGINGAKFEYYQMSSSLATQIKEKEHKERETQLQARLRHESECRIAASKELESACITGTIDKMRAALEAGADIEYANDLLKQRPVHLCAYYGHLEALDFLLSKGALVRSTDMKGRTALHLSCETYLESGRAVEVCKYLLNHGCDLVARDINGNTPVHIAAACGNLAVLHLFKAYAETRFADNLSLICLKNNIGQSPINLCLDQKPKRILKPKTESACGLR